MADSAVNCHLAEEVGLAAMAKMHGKTFGDLHLAWNDSVVPMLHDAEQEKRNEADNISTFALFYRMCRMGVSQQQMEEYMKYELAS